VNADAASPDVVDGVPAGDSRRADPEPFDLSGPLPGAGVTVLEASAGTGKTHALTSLITRFVAAGTPLDTILAVTFTRMATGELRQRTRDRLIEVGRALATLGTAVPGAGSAAPVDPVVAAVAAGGATAVATARARIADAVTDFDAATVTTTHGFCQLVLAGLGTAGDLAPRAELLEDAADLVEEVVGDLYLRRALRHGAPNFSVSRAVAVARAAVRNPDARVVPGPGESGPGLLSRLATAARAEVDRRLLDANQLTYDHLLSRLAGTLADERRGPLACSRLRARYRVVLVDEFQDTDPVQWEVLRRAFADGTVTLVLVGDPKQSIYSFRGADVQSYLDAAGRATTWTLATNWRADAALLDATEALLSPLQFGDPRIRFRAVAPAPGRPRSGLRGPTEVAPLRIRTVERTHPGITRTPRTRQLQKGALTRWVAGDVAADVARLLGAAGAGGAEVHGADGWRPVRAADVAVLTRTNLQSLDVRDALRAAGVASVVAGLDTVFASEGAAAWLRLLEALEEPSSRSRMVALALTAFVGMDVTTVATAGEERWEAVHARVARWAGVLAEGGVATLQRVVTVDEGIPARVLGTVGGERVLTDMGHVAHLLHRESLAGRAGAPTLRAWLADRIDEAGTSQTDAEERSRRLDSDDEAVQVLTVHRAKGLEFGIVYCPYLWHAAQASRAPSPVVLHDPGPPGGRILDVGCDERRTPGRVAYDAHLTLATAEQRDEDLRAMYVALTRARHQVVMWWAPTTDCQHSPLGRVLLGRDPATGAVAKGRSQEPGDAEVLGIIARIAGRAPAGAVAVEQVGAGADDSPTGRPSPATGKAPLSVARFDRQLDARWGRSSYTSITAAAHGAPLVGSEPEEPGTGDEPDGSDGGLPSPGSIAGGAEASDRGDGAAGVVSPMADVPGGREIGTFVHAVLEHVDFAASDLPAGVAAAIASQPGWLAASAGPAGDLVTLRDGLVAALTTPLGPVVGDTSLAGLARGDRLDELGFELPLAGGDRPTGEVRTGDLARVLARHLPADGTLAGYPDRLDDPVLATSLRGYLTGSIDLVFRRLGPDGTTRWHLADYKTNRLASGDGPLTAWDYRPAALDAEMQRRHYPLQALLYAVALHRYLQWRLVGYDPALHLGGVAYLFLRGMVGPAGPTVGGRPCGVWTWQPGPGLVTECSELFEGGRRW
jgi:exodeoxyribonuclease V beta subunit